MIPCDKILFVRGRGVVVQHAALSRPRSRVRIPSLPLKVRDFPRTFCYTKEAVLQSIGLLLSIIVARSAINFRKLLVSLGYVK